VNFSKLYPVEHNLPVTEVGKIHARDLAALGEYFGPLVSANLEDHELPYEQ
jgi:hypothetical protein